MKRAKGIIKKLKNIYSSDLFFYGFLIFAVILLGQLPIILHYFHNIEGYYYPLLDRPAYSDFYYLALVRFGMGSDWLLQIPYVTIPHKASLIQVFFVLLGKLSFYTGIGPAEVFAIFRVIGGVVFTVSVALLLKLILKKKQARLCFIFFLFAQPWLLVDVNQYLFQNYDDWWWHFGEAARRISTMPPHYTLGKGLAILSLVLIISHFKNKKLSFALASSILAFIAGLVYPPPVFTILFALSVAFFIYVLYIKFNLKAILTKYKLYPVVLFVLGIVFSLVLLRMELAKGYPWSQWNKVELGWNDPSMRFELDYLRMLGFLILFVPFSLKKVFSRNEVNYLSLFLFFWFISSFMLFPFANVLKLGKFRLIEGAQIVPMAILSLWGLEYMQEKIRNVGKLPAKLFKITIISLVVVAFIVSTTSQAIWSTKRLWGYWTNVYFSPDSQTALAFLRENVEQDAIVMADLSPSNYIPAFAKVKTIIGFPDFFVIPSDFFSNLSMIQSVLNETADSEDLEKYLKYNKVDYVYRENYEDKQYYPKLLDRVFKNFSYKIYKVKEGVR